MAEVIILSDEEFYERQAKQKRKNFLSELEQMSKPSKSNSFSIKDINSPKEESHIKPEQEDSLTSYSTNLLPPANNEESDWGSFVEDLQGFEISPIESITDEAITGFQLDPNITESDDNKYGKVFKKELAMLSEVLKDVKAHGSRVDGALKKMNIGGKGNSSRVTGIPKGYSDLVEAYNSINTTKIQVIKAMGDLRSKQIDWQFKDKSNNPAENESTDSIADMYYKRIVGGGTKNFIENSLNNYQHANFDYDTIVDEQDQNINGETQDPSTIDALAISTGFNITQPIQGSSNYEDNDILGDEYGYISHEKNDYEVVAYQYGDGHFQMGALDKFGEPLEGVELPTDVNPDILNSLKLRPGSNFVYDKYGRSYRVVEMGSVDISDVDDMDYPF